MSWAVNHTLPEKLAILASNPAVLFDDGSMSQSSSGNIAGLSDSQKIQLAEKVKVFIQENIQGIMQLQNNIPAISSLSLYRKIYLRRSPCSGTSCIRAFNVIFYTYCQ